MKLAILMATYNGEKYLNEQIDSILNQETQMPFELIVRDDGSTDGTRQILQEYADNGKIRFCAGSNTGAAKGFIKLLLDNPGYDFYAFSDQDDVWHSNKIQKGLDAIMNTRGPALYCSNTEIVDPDLNSIGRNTHRERPTYNLVSILCLASCAQGCTSVFNRDLAEIIQQHGMPDVFIMHDSMLTGLCALIDGKIVYDHEPSMLYRMHGSNVAGMSTAKQGKMKVIKSRITEITKKRKIGMYIQVKSLLDTYGNLISDDNKRVCRTVIGSERCLMDRLKLVFDKNLKHDTLNKTITKKLTILLGND